MIILGFVFCSSRVRSPVDSEDRHKFRGTELRPRGHGSVIPGESLWKDVARRGTNLSEYRQFLVFVGRSTSAASALMDSLALAFAAPTTVSSAFCAVSTADSQAPPAVCLAWDKEAHPLHKLEFRGGAMDIQSEIINVQRPSWRQFGNRYLTYFPFYLHYKHSEPTKNRPCLASGHWIRTRSDSVLIIEA